ncbi:MAG: 3-phosphoshikimate 1-carboxyvinyltransferase [Rhodanobacteraceae bacterium]|nr:3-phosphoshikimate 1-carboxyvinyltransferase [Rhodanobacteraceae bacterium]
MSGGSREYRLAPASRVQGRFAVPGDKSISHRAVMFGALANGTTHVSGFLPGADTLATAQILRDLGVSIERTSETELRIKGVGFRGCAPAQPLDCGNAGTAMRLLAGLLAGQRFASTLIGDESLSRRPMRRIMDPLTRMGARISSTEAGTAPLRIEPVATLNGIDYTCPVASAQIKSCVLLAGLYAQGETRVTEPAATIAAACAKGVSTVRGAHELRVKESDRIAAMARGLTTLGIHVEEFEDGMAIEGAEAFGSGSIDSRGDHRIAMSFAVASLRARGELRILDCANVDTSFPGFVELAAAAGLAIAVCDSQQEPSA